MPNTYLERNMTGNTASTKMTFSCWLKLNKTDDDGRIFGAQALACHSYWNGDGRLNVDFSQKDSGSVVAKLLTTRKFRDTNAWYHIVFALDTTLGTADDRIKLWVNGVQETAFDTRTNASQDVTYAYGQSGYYTVGARTSNQGGAGHYFDGLMSHVHYCDGYAYSASDFGSTDSTTGEWKINTSPSVTYGTNGFFILKDGNSGTDQSPNTNNFTASGDLTKTEDCPSNVFATLNPLWRSRFENDVVLSKGNLKASFSSSSNRGYAMSSIGVTSGKYYFEVKAVDKARLYIGVGDGNYIAGLTSAIWSANPSNGIALNVNSGNLEYNGTDNTSYGTGASDNDIIQVALDMDNYLLWFGVNGTWMNSATQTQIENGTATYDVTTAIGTKNIINNGEPINIFALDGSTSGTSDAEFNFGNGYFGTTAVSSAGTNASGIGIFEYDVPTGYTALSTKGLNE